MSDELQELKEHAEAAEHDPSLAPISLTMAILAVLVAGVTLLGHRAHTEEVILQNKVTDQWGYYQAKNIRRNTDEDSAAIVSLMTPKDPAQATQLHDKLTAEADRYRDEAKELEAKGHELEDETKHEARRADRFDLGEATLEIALVITSITLLSGRKLFWLLGIFFGIAGVVLAVTGVLL
ncbi:MAG: DUF4337 domain-containing protein [Terriglobales bacterium]|jgi:hypothetical protein